MRLPQRAFRTATPIGFSTVVLTTLLLFCCNNLRADLIYDNGLQIGDTDFFSYSFTGTSTGAQSQMADDFFFGDGAWLVDGASWAGLLRDNNSFQTTVGVTIQFDLLVFEDNGGQPTGTPLDPVPGTAIAHRVVTATGTDTNFYPDTVAQYEASFAPILLDGGTTYWIVFAARDDFSYINGIAENGSGWGWLGRSGTGNAWQGGTNFQSNWLQQNRQQYFQLFGQAAIPEPSSTAFLGVCLIGSWLRRRR